VTIFVVIVTTKI